jgi:hypothetical protein
MFYVVFGSFLSWGQNVADKALVEIKKVKKKEKLIRKTQSTRSYFGL